VNGPWIANTCPGDWMFLAEDGEGTNHLVGATPSGEAFFFA
jgi:hypothetical protein